LLDEHGKLMKIVPGTSRKEVTRHKAYSVQRKRAEAWNL
jgi:hypothetical protein